MNILALEASTSAAKALLYIDGKVTGIVHKNYPDSVGDTVSLDADAVVSLVIECGRELLAQHNINKIDAIGLCSIWHSLLLLNKNSAPIGRVQTWADTAPALTVAKARKSGLSDRLYSATGCPAHSMYGLWKWMHLKENGVIPDGVCRLSGMGEYLFFRLTGEHLVSQSMANGSSFLNIHTLQYDNEVLSLAGLDAGMLPTPVAPSASSPLNEAASKTLGLGAGVPVVVTGPDGAFNHIAAGGLGGDTMTLSIGTSGAVRLSSSAPVVPDKPSNWCYYGDEGRYIAGGATSGAGNCVKWLCKTLFAETYSYAELDSMAERQPIETAPYFLPFLYGERCPGWQDTRRGQFAALDGSHGPGAMQYALLEGILFHLYQNYQAVVASAGKTPSLVSLSGGILFSPFWLQLCADIFGLELSLNAGEHASTLGAAYMAMKAAGGISSLCSVNPKAENTVAPNPDRHALLKKRYLKWLALYSSQVV